MTRIVGFSSVTADKYENHVIPNQLRHRKHGKTLQYFRTVYPKGLKMMVHVGHKIWLIVREFRVWKRYSMSHRQWFMQWSVYICGHIWTNFGNDEFDRNLLFSKYLPFISHLKFLRKIRQIISQKYIVFNFLDQRNSIFTKMNYFTCGLCQKDDSDMLPKLEIKRIESISRETQTDRQFRKTVSAMVW